MHERKAMTEMLWRTGCFVVTSQITLDIKRQIKQINDAIEKFA